MESNSNDNYVLVLGDRTEVKNENDAGKLSVVSGFDDKGKLQTTEAKDVHQAAFLKFNNKDGLLKNFMTNFLKLFNEPSRFGLYKVVSNNVEQSVASLHTLLQNREKPENKQQLAMCTTKLCSVKEALSRPSTICSRTWRRSFILDTEVSQTLLSTFWQEWRLMLSTI